MDTDFMLVLGMVLAILSLPSMLSAYSDDRSVRGPVVFLVIALALMAYAVVAHPGGYALEQIPEVFFGVVARFLP